MDDGAGARRGARDDRVDAAACGGARRSRRLRPRPADDDGARPARRRGDGGGRVVIGPWDRIEGSPHDDELDAGVEAHLADPLWLLTRQWQVGELRADDAARPVAARLEWRAAPVQTYRPGRRRAAAADARGRPLERVVEAAPPPTVVPPGCAGRPGSPRWSPAVWCAPGSTTQSPRWPVPRLRAARSTTPWRSQAPDHRGRAAAPAQLRRCRAPRRDDATIGARLPGSVRRGATRRSR